MYLTFLANFIRVTLMTPFQVIHIISSQGARFGNFTIETWFSAIKYNSFWLVGSFLLVLYNLNVWAVFVYKFSVGMPMRFGQLHNSSLFAMSTMVNICMHMWQMQLLFPLFMARICQSFE